jgi:hypothetical protein
MELADLPGHPARVVANKHKLAMDNYLADLFAKAGVPDAHERAREVALLAEGAMVKILIHGDRSFAATAAAAAKRLLATEPGARASMRRPSQAGAKLSR